MKWNEKSGVLAALGLTSGLMSLHAGVPGSNTGLRTEKRPNVILVMTDDQGYGELSCHGNPVLQTPELDRLYRQSIRLSDFHVAPMCAPTRGQLITGLDAARNGTVNVSSGRTLLRPEIPTMADIFADQGYKTGIFGKWHLGDNFPFRPEDRGFQETIWFPSSHIHSVPDFWGNDYFDDTYIHNGKRQSYEGYCTDIFFNSAMDFMKQSMKEGKPFLVYLPTNTPHVPLIAPEKDIREMEQAFADSPFSDMEENLKTRLIKYMAMIRNIDWNMGRLMEFLKKEGLEKNTILIFTTDNGSTQGPRYYNAGMRGMKTELYEGGHRVPFFIRWPGGNLGKPRDVDGLTQVQDVLPTLLDLCNLEAPAGVAFDGVSLAPVLRGEQEVDKERMLVINYSRMPMGFDYPSPHAPSHMTKEGAGVLWKSWRLLEDRELYNLEEDPLQENNVIEQYPEVVKYMRATLDNWWEEVKHGASDIQRVVIGSDAENPMMLTACEWLDVFVDQQYQVNRGVRKNSYWELMVDRPGIYEFEFRRWPRELDIPLDETVPGGKALPIAAARIFISGVRHVEVKVPFAFEGERKRVKPGDKSVVFTVPLEAGPVALHGWFDDRDGETLCGPYYVYVNRIEEN
ncbi:MAG TPA: arylsulfatase [Bacteroidetes bacterium]|nr:arylsulfatase [Bacteroidota bacterium]